MVPLIFQETLFLLEEIKLHGTTLGKKVSEVLKKDFLKKFSSGRVREGLLSFLPEPA
jgi:hypothetical protein